MMKMEKPSTTPTYPAALPVRRRKCGRPGVVLGFAGEPQPCPLGLRRKMAVSGPLDAFLGH